MCLSEVGGTEVTRQYIILQRLGGLWLQTGQLIIETAVIYINIYIHVYISLSLSQFLPFFSEHRSTRFLHSVRLFAVFSASIHSIPISARSSLKVLLQVFFGRPLFLFPPSGIHVIAFLAGLCAGMRSICPAIFLLLVSTVISISSDPVIFITSLLLMWSLHDIPKMVRRHLR